jgi:DNA-binding CsgD family transcriptional regulator
VEKEKFERVLRKRATPKLAVLTMDCRLLSSEPDLHNFLASFGISRPADANSLPSELYDRIRALTAEWPRGGEEAVSAAWAPVNGLLMQISQLCGPDGCCIAVTFERFQLRADVRENAARFGLTEREADVAELVMQGSTGEHVAERLGIARNTVREHLKHIHAKLGVSTRAELVYRLLHPSLE